MSPEVGFAGALELVLWAVELQPQLARALPLALAVVESSLSLLLTSSFSSVVQVEAPGKSQVSFFLVSQTDPLLVFGRHLIT